MMTKPTINIIVAISKQTRAIGKGNELLWRIPDDLKRFKALTTGHPIIMGRKTYESIGKPLLNRTNIIVTRNDSYIAPECVVVASIEDAITEASKLDAQVFIIGGAEIYRETIDIADRLYLTVIEGDKEADVFFPAYGGFQKLVSEESKMTEDGLKYKWLTLEK
jgi:dihydrofolate reductase